MSDLAPFVAAAIRDRTVVELLDENKKKDQIMDEMMHVQVTGPNGTPVYADGQFNKGHYGPGVHQWFPSMNHRQDCPLSELGGVQVRLGGVIQFSLDPDRDQEVFIRLDFSEAHHNLPGGGKDMLIQPDDGAELYVDVYGWDESDWGPLLESGAWDEAASSALNYFANMPADNNRVVEFNSLSFNVKKYESMIRHVQLSEEALRERDQQLERHDFVKAVFQRAEASGLDPPHVHSIYMLVSSNLKIDAIDEDFERVIGPLINIHLLRQNDEDPFSLHRELVAIINRCGVRQEQGNRSQALTNFVEQIQEMTRQHQDPPPP